jgi:hypothetical protein
MSEDVHETNNVVPTDPPVPRVLAPVPTPEPTVNPAAPPSDAGDWSDKCVCGWRTEDLREDSNFWGQVDFPSPKTATDFFVCPKCNRVLRIYMKSTRRGV